VRRRIIREKVVQALYAREVGGDPIPHVIQHILKDLKVDKDAHEFAKSLVIETVNHAAEIDKIIKGKVANWDFKRIALLDRLILRMAICELMYFKDIPPKVSMDEAIELAKLFSTEKSGQFVNGVLDAILEEMVAAGELSKAGRGLNQGTATHRVHKAKGANPE
jgi:transcription antitermination protein NusB